MGTRGAFGFKKNNKLKTIYNNFDSYYTGLGDYYISILKKYDNDYISKIFDNIVEINEIKLSPEIIFYLSDFNSKIGEELFDLNYIRKQFKDKKNNEDVWSDLFYGVNNYFEVYFTHKLKYMYTDNYFLKDTMFCEYGYVYNIDDENLEIYRYGKKAAINISKDKIDNDFVFKINNDDDYLEIA